MWPFKKTPAVAAPPTPSPCSNDEVHAYWRAKGWLCPRCCAMEAMAKKDRERTQLAEEIATKVVAKLKET